MAGSEIIGVSVGFIAWLGVGLQGLKADLGLRLSIMLCELCSIGIGDVVWLREPAARTRGWLGGRG